MPEMPAVAALRDVGTEIDTLRTLGAAPTAATLARWSAKIGEALEAEEARWLSEERARRRGRSMAWLRRRFGAWETIGLARFRDGRREYHETAIPVQVLELPAPTAREQARRDAA